MFSWYGEYENGNSAQLRFDGDDGYLSVQNPDFTLDICGLCVMTDDDIILCDRDSGYHYQFVYRLYGNRLELTLNGASITLDKV